MSEFDDFMYENCKLDDGINSMSKKVWNHQQKKVDDLESKLQSVLNLACKLQHSSGDRIYSEIKELLK